MKISILTLPLHANYGGIIQAYALQTTLERMGHEVSVISRPLRLSPGRYAYVKYIKRFIWKYLLKRGNFVFLEKRYNRRQKLIETNTKRFISQYIKLKNIHSFDELVKDDVNAMVVGSDQVWRPVYFCGMFKSKLENAYLEFAKDWDIKRVAYAPSFGTDEWEYDKEQTASCRRLIQMFDAVSVREESGVRLCKDYLGRTNVEWVLDPTMLLEKEDYENLIPQGLHADGDLMYYVLEETTDIRDLISKIAKKQSLKPFQTNANVVDASSLEEVYPQPPVEQWLVGFRDAKLVVTDSFHACVFSILFHKPFVVIGNKGRGYSRFESLLKLFGLQNRLIEDVSQFKNSMLEPLTEDVYEKLAVYRKNSREFLYNVLETC